MTTAVEYPVMHNDYVSSHADQKAEKFSTVEHVEKLDPHLGKALTVRTTKYMIIFSAWIALGGWLVNFDLGYTGIVLQMRPFNAAFGACVANAATKTTVCKLTASQQSCISLYILFMAVGGGLSSITGTFLGRKHVLMLSNLIISIGAAGMLGSTGNYAAYVVCKCIGGIGIGHLVATCPVYGAECTPSKRRGLLVAFYSVGLSCGSVVVALVCLGSQTITDDWCWKTPILLQIPVATIYSIGLLAFPESPRWFMVKGREEEARKSFSRFYKKDPHSPEIDAQIHDIQITLENENTNNTTWVEIFHKKYIRRTFASSSIIIGSTLSGVNFVIPYATIFLADLGIKNPFQVTVYLNCCVFAGCLVGPFLCQYLGRRRTLISGYLCMSGCLIIFASVATAKEYATEELQNVLIAFLCMWTFCFGAFNASTTWLASAEQHSVRHRTYGQAFTILTSSIFNFAANFWTPYMINISYGNMGTNVGYFYCGLTLCFAIITFLTIPETGNLTLEQIDRYYASGLKPWKTSLKANKLV